jgi:hypothetical protein
LARRAPDRDSRRRPGQEPRLALGPRTRGRPLSFAGYVVLARTVFGQPAPRISWWASLEITLAAVGATRGAGGIALTAWAGPQPRDTLPSIGSAIASANGLQLVKQSLAIGQAAANPCRHLACAGRHPSSRLALAFDAPRISVIITTPASPANSRPTSRGTRIGFFAPSVCASAGNQSATGAGSSSTTL